MTTIVLKSKVRTASEHSVLSLNIRHHLLLGQWSGLLSDTKPTMIPDAVDVLLFSNLLITVSGSLDGMRITPAELRTSHIANHLVVFLRTYTEELGINAVSDLYVSEDTHLLSLTLTASRQFSASTDALPVHLELISLDLDYVWQTNSSATISGRLDVAFNPFARHLSLPYLTAADNVVGRFVTFHLVRRYPLIFGPWCKQLDIECSLFPSILISIQNIMDRSHSPVFRATCEKLFKLCKHELISTSISTAGALSKYLGLETAMCSAPPIYTHNEAQAFFLCLERFYRVGMKRPNFRHMSLFPTIETGSSEDLLSDTVVTLDTCGVNCSSNQPSDTSGLLPHVSIFGGTYMDRSSDPEPSTEDDHRVTPPYQNQNDIVLDQIYHLTGTAFDAGISDHDLCDDIHELSEDAVGSYGIFFGQHPLDRIDRCNDDSSVVAADSDIDSLLEESDGIWAVSTHHGWSPDSLCSQEYEQDILEKTPSPGAYSMAQPLKMPSLLAPPTAFEDIPDPSYLGCSESDVDPLRKHNPNALTKYGVVPYGATFRSWSQTENILRACPVSQENLSSDHYFGREFDMQAALMHNLVSKTVITNGNHETMAFDGAFAANSSQAFISRSGTQALFSNQHPGQPMRGFGEGPVVGVTADDYRFLAIEYDSDVAD